MNNSEFSDLIHVILGLLMLSRQLDKAWNQEEREHNGVLCQVMPE